MKSFTFFALIAVAAAIQIEEPWKKSTLPDCPEPSRTVMDDGKTHVVKYPMVGATCKEGAATLAQVSAEPGAAVPPPNAEQPKPKVAPWVGLQHCPNMSERMTLVDGQTKAIPWPAAGANCHKEGPVTAQMN